MYKEYLEDYQKAIGALRAATTMLGALDDEQKASVFAADIFNIIDIVKDRLEVDVEMLREEMLTKKKAAPKIKEAPESLADETDAKNKTDHINDTPKGPEKSKFPNALDASKKMEIISMLKEGMGAKVIAKKIGCAVSTVYKIRSEVM